MIDSHINNPKSIKFYVKAFLEQSAAELEGRVVLDFPAGNGATSELLLNLGTKMEAFDLFPEYFMLEGIECRRADIAEKIPVGDGHADWVVCQEGIEHFSDQLKALKEFNRVLKKGGKLLLTTPSYSNLAARFSYLMFESEAIGKWMPPNEIDSIWMSDKAKSREIYHGHIFLIGLQKLRVLARLAGFKISEVRYVRLSKGSLALFPFVYPFLLATSYWTYFKNLRRHKNIEKQKLKSVYTELLRLNIAPRHLLNKHIFVIFEKENDLDEVDFRFESVVKPFGKIM